MSQSGAVSAYVSPPSPALLNAPTGNSFAFVGDSRLAQYNVDSTTSKIWRNSPHFFTWANAQLGQRLQVTFNNSGPGLRTDQYLVQLPAAIASGSKFLLLWSAVNDISQGSTPTMAWTGAGAPTTSIGLKGAAQLAIASGMSVILGGEPGATGFSSTQMGYCAQLNQLMREFCEQTPSAYYFDAPGIMQDPTQTVVAFKPNYSSDGIHTICLGGYNLGIGFANLISPLIPPFSQQQHAAWDVPANAGVNLLTNPFFLTATGGTPGTNTTGTIPANWFVAGSTNVAVASSTTPGPYGNDTVLTLTASAAGTAQMYFFLGPGAVGAGNIYQAAVEYTVANGSSNFCPPTLNILIQADGINYQPGDMFAQASLGNGPTTAYTNVLRTPKFTMPGFTTATQFYLYKTFTFSGPGSATVNLRRPELRKRFG
jgi:hypothetical protein